ncbi:MAG TPA: LPS export ABC transporter periplasmic protein LptC [Methylococcaceae bacterium]|jgi:lipopolysaccharide export system protein LptC|nr:LPS export ABC transporter periplasmic protein LptC [Methylococcaceae bacterium]
MITPKTFGTYLALGLLAAATWRVADNLMPAEEKTLKPERSEIDYYSTNVKRTVLTPEGKPKEVLFAVTMTHYKNDDRTEMDKPVLTLYKKEGEQPWVIHSDTATALSSGSTVFLKGDVLITRDTGENGVVRIMTKNAKVEPDKSYAETREHVLILSPQDELSGTGMQVHFEPALQVNLLAQVRRKHEMR